jgi:hypothetical protein
MDLADATASGAHRQGDADSVAPLSRAGAAGSGRYGSAEGASPDGTCPGSPRTVIIRITIATMRYPSHNAAAAATCQRARGSGANCTTVTAHSYRRGHWTNQAQAKAAPPGAANLSHVHSGSQAHSAAHWRCLAVGTPSKARAPTPTSPLAAGACPRSRCAAGPCQCARPPRTRTQSTLQPLDYCQYLISTLIFESPLQLPGRPASTLSTPGPSRLSDSA